MVGKGEDSMDRLKVTATLAKRTERRSAAWGKRLAALVLILAANNAFGQNFEKAERELPLSPRITAEMNHEISLARAGQGGNQNLKVIVQYHQAPTAAHIATMRSRGGKMNVRLDLVKGASFTIPVSALASLEADPEIEHVSLDHSVRATDDYTNAAMNVSAVVNAGYDGTGIGVAVIDSGINDQHYDWQDKNWSYNRVIVHADFTGANQYNSAGVLVHDTYGHGTHVERKLRRRGPERESAGLSRPRRKWVGQRQRGHRSHSGGGEHEEQP
jgi:hypothetical protein